MLRLRLRVGYKIGKIWGTSEYLMIRKVKVGRDRKCKMIVPVDALSILTIFFTKFIICGGAKVERLLEQPVLRTTLIKFDVALFVFVLHETLLPETSKLLTWVAGSEIYLFIN